MKRLKLFCLLLALVITPATAATIFTESMGTVSATTTIATHEANNGFDNDGYTMNAGGATTPGDIRSTSPSSGYSGASGAANIWLTSSTGAYGFAINGINASGYTNLLLSFAFRKEGAAALPTFTVDYSIDGGSSWTPITVTGLPATNAAVAWYYVPDLALPVDAQVSNLAIRWVKQSGSIAMRLDDVKLTGTSAGFDYGVNPVAHSKYGVESSDPVNSRTVTSVLTATNLTTVTAVTLTAGSTEWAYTGSSSFSVAAAGTANLNFVYTPAANDGVADVTTFTVTTSSNTPASVQIVLTGTPVKVSTLAGFRTDAEAGSAGITIVYKISDAIVGADNLQNGRNQLYVQNEATGSASTRGLLVDDPSGLGKSGNGGVVASAGSTLTMYGHYLNYNGAVEFVIDRPYAVTATGAALVPLTLANSTLLSDNNESVLVTLPNVVVPAATYAPVSNTNYTVTDDASNTFTMRILVSAGISVTVNGSPQPLTGIASQFDATHPVGGTGYQIFPRFAADVPVEISSFTAE